MRERRAERDAELDAHYRDEFARRIRALYPNCPEPESVAIAEHACRKYSGRVGRTAEAKRFDGEAIALAVNAHIRHVHTDYDRLLGAGWDRHEARAHVRSTIERVIAGWSQP